METSSPFISSILHLDHLIAMFLAAGGHRRPITLPMTFMFSPSMTASLIVKSSNACLKSPPVKVSPQSLCLFVGKLTEIVTVTAVESGWRALQYLGLDEEKTLADFVNVDLIIQGSATFREVPVLIISSENVIAWIDRCLEEGAEDFIVKPVKLSELGRLKKAVLKGATLVATRPSDQSVPHEVPDGLWASSAFEEPFGTAAKMLVNRTYCLEMNSF